MFCVSNYILENDWLRVTVSDLGAELLSIYDIQKEQEYLWYGDKKYWPRRAPVLFPFVGITKNKQYTFEGRRYGMTQHGFARDMVFECTEQTPEVLWFKLCANEETMKSYPFDFVLELGYELSERSLKVLWKVTNPADRTMYFSIGAHPGFLCPLKAEEKRSSYFIDFHTDKDITYSLIKQDGLVGIYGEHLALDHGIAAVDDHMFDRDALIIEDKQTQEVSLLDGEKKPYLTVRFDAPLFGVWAPPGGDTPFVCIEPWYGRCDSVDFDGELHQRDYEQAILAHGIFEKAYVIDIH